MVKNKLRQKLDGQKWTFSYFKKDQARHMISVGDLFFFFSKQILLRDCQIVQQIAAKPTMCIFTFFDMYLIPHCRYWDMLEGLQSAPITQAIKLQT
jgi:hypothetical protein